mgnify:CR=1 FL=1
MTDDKLFTPEFVYEICVGLAIHDFLTKDLPLQLCSIGVYLAAFNLIYRNQTIFNLIFYWAFVGATNAILTPDGDLFELRIFFFYSQGYHAALIFAVLWMMIKYDMRMDYKSILQVVIYTNIIVGFITIVLSLIHI